MFAAINIHDNNPNSTTKRPICRPLTYTKKPTIQKVMRRPICSNYKTPKICVVMGMAVVVDGSSGGEQWSDSGSTGVLHKHKQTQMYQN